MGGGLTVSTCEKNEWEAKCKEMNELKIIEGQNAFNNIKICAETKALIDKYLQEKKEKGEPTTMEKYYGELKSGAKEVGLHVFALSVIKYRAMLWNDREAIKVHWASKKPLAKCTVKEWQTAYNTINNKKKSTGSEAAKKKPHAAKVIKAAKKRVNAIFNYYIEDQSKGCPPAGLNHNLEQLLKELDGQDVEAFNGGGDCMETTC